jgi:peptide/nickel transport system permease protein
MVVAVFARGGQWGPIWRHLRQDRIALAGGAFLVLLVLLALLAPLLPLRDPNHGYYELLPLNGHPLPPSASFPLGSDTNGRDVLSRLIWGARISLLIGFVANGLALLVGLTVGALAGYMTGWVETALMRLTDVMMAFPVLLFSIALVSILYARGGDSGNVLVLMAVIALFYWTAVARIVRGQVLSIKEREFVEAARALGGGPFKILFKHVLPHLSPVLVVYGTIGIATSIATEATLSYLGIGVQPPTADWGNMVAQGQGAMFVAPWLVLAPGLAILLTVLAFNLVGDSLRDALDPRAQALVRGPFGALRAGGGGLTAEPVAAPVEVSHSGDADIELMEEAS